MPSSTSHPADINNDGRVDNADLLQVIQAMGWERPGNDPDPGGPQDAFNEARWTNLLQTSPDIDTPARYLRAFTGPSEPEDRLDRRDHAFRSSVKGEVIEGVRFGGPIVIDHDDIVLRDCIIDVSSNNQFQNAALYGLDDRWPWGRGTVLERVLFRYVGDPVDGGYTYRGGTTAHTLLIACRVQDPLWGFEVSSNTLIDRCIIERGPNPRGWHSASVTVKDARDGATIRNSVLLHGTTGAVQCWSPHAPVQGLRVERCVLAAEHANYQVQGGYTPTDGDHWAEMRDHSYTDNLIGEGKSGLYHPGEVVPGTVWRNNRVIRRRAA